MRFLMCFIISCMSVYSANWKCTVVSMNGASNLLMKAKNGIVTIKDDEGITLSYDKPYDNEGILQYSCIEYKEIGLDLSVIKKNQLKIEFYKNNHMTSHGNCYRDN